jgi:hypothetical protein
MKILKKGVRGTRSPKAYAPPPPFFEFFPPQARVLHLDNSTKVLILQCFYSTLGSKSPEKWNTMGVYTPIVFHFSGNIQLRRR